jgi:hypothetical protein
MTFLGLQRTTKSMYDDVSVGLDGIAEGTNNKTFHACDSVGRRLVSAVSHYYWLKFFRRLYQSLPHGAFPVPSFTDG